MVGEYKYCTAYAFYYCKQTGVFNTFFEQNFRLDSTLWQETK